MNNDRVGWKLARLKRKRELCAKRHRGVNDTSVAENLACEMNEDRVGYKLARLKRRRELFAKRHRGVNDNSFAENLARMDRDCYQLLSDLQNSGQIMGGEPQIYSPSSSGRLLLRGSSSASRGAGISRSNRGSSSREQEKNTGDNAANQSPSPMLHAAEVVNVNEHIINHDCDNIMTPTPSDNITTPTPTLYSDPITDGIDRSNVGQKFYLTSLDYNHFAGLAASTLNQFGDTSINQIHFGPQVENNIISQRDQAQELSDTDDEILVLSSTPLEYNHTTDANVPLSRDSVQEVSRPTRNRVIARSILRERNVECRFCGALMWLEEKLFHSSKINPRFGLCCQSGKVLLDMLPQSPEYLDELLRDRLFMENIRSLNSMFCFTSMGGKIDRSVQDGIGPPCFKISGVNHHRIGSLLPSPVKMYSFAQLYICDTENEVHNRLNFLRNGVTDSGNLVSMVEGLKGMLDNVNPYVQVFRRARDALRHDSGVDLHIRILHSRSIKQYNQPIASEIAAIIVGDDTDAARCRDIIVCKNDGYLKRISETHPSYTPLQYPILFPYGTDGWRIGIPYNVTSGHHKISMREFWAFRLQHRNLEGTTLLQGGRLYSQLIVDCYAAIEEQRLNYIKTHQADLRGELYQGLEDAVVTGDTDASAVGRRVVLPSSFTGGPRNLMKHYQNAMAICRTIGPPDFIITFTCNPNWPEISRELTRFPGQHADDRPDIVARVFRMKQKQLMKLFKEKTFFGTVLADVSVVEFQKRGLPHSHMTLTLAEGDKPATPDDINPFICAEIPDKDNDPLAYETVTRCMVHGPCGVHNPDASCMIGGKCSKYYPKEFCDRTTVNDDGYVAYRRRNDPNNTFMVNGVEIDNRWIIPYNRDLLVLFDCHINVEKCASLKSMKYVYKYKGTDQATFVIENNIDGQSPNGQKRYKSVDEVKQYLDCRYISAIEACWRIYEFELQSQNPSVELLPYHLPNQQFVIFSEGENLHRVVTREGARHTMLTKWFEANKKYVEARSLTYVEFPTTWVWKRETKEWVPRKHGKSIGRLPYSHPSCGEKYYLCMLLYKVCGTQCFEDVRTFSGVVYQTFKQACFARALLDDDNEWHEALSEAETWASSIKLRNLFSTMLMFSHITDTVNLWEQHWRAMVDDLQYSVRQKLMDDHIELSNEDLKECVLREIENTLNINGKSLADFPPMPQPSCRSFSHVTNRLIQEELDYDESEEEQSFCSYFDSLNVDQLKVYNAIIQAYEIKRGGLFFVNGNGGTGKTYLWKTIIAKFRSQKKIVLSVASSGIAALLLPGGRTAHSRFKIPLDLDETSGCPINLNTDLAKLMQEASLIIWDEAPMTHRYGFEAVNKTLNDLLKGTENFSVDKPFGGKLCILGGDFKQILPVVTRGRRKDIVAASLHTSKLWNQCIVMHLKINMRLIAQDGSTQSIDQLRNYAEWINMIGEGKAKCVHTENGISDWVELPEELLIENGDNSLSELINATYPELSNKYKDPAYLKERAILAPKNSDVDDINSIMLSMLPGEVRQFCSLDTLCPGKTSDHEKNMNPPELLNSIEISGVPNHCLELKEGSPVVLLRNLNQSLGLCNGTRLIITKMGERVLEARVITGSHFGEEVLIPRIIFSTTESQTFVHMKRRQFPVKLAFAMTINKSQGQTLDRVGLYLPNPVFTHGQLYVALSRVTNPLGLKVLICNESGIPRNCTRNVVYLDVLAAVN